MNFVDPLGLDQDPPTLTRRDPNAPFDFNFEQPIRGSERTGTFGGLEIGSMVIETPGDDASDAGGGGGARPRPTPTRQRKLDPSHQECQALARKIDNLIRSIHRRAEAILRNDLKLPLDGPGPLKDTIEGHRKLIKRDVENLEQRRQEYADKCGGGPGGPGGVPVSPPVIAPRSNPGSKMSPAPSTLPAILHILFIMVDPCLTNPRLCSRPNSD